jgi:hypothetical protein
MNIIVTQYCLQIIWSIHRFGDAVGIYTNPSSTIYDTISLLSLFRRFIVFLCKVYFVANPMIFQQRHVLRGRDVKVRSLQRQVIYFTGSCRHQHMQISLLFTQILCLN